MISGDALLFGALLALLVAAVAIAVVVGGGWCLILSIFDLARGYAEKSYLRALKVFVLFSALTGFIVLYVCCMDGLTPGLLSLIHGSKTFNSLVFWTPFTVQMCALIVVILAWRKRQKDSDESEGDEGS